MSNQGVIERVAKALDDLPSFQDYEDLATAALSALRAGDVLPGTGLVVEHDWQDIATAPKDGTRVDLWVHPWTGKCYRASDYWWVDAIGWRSGLREKDIPARFRVTHWKPIAAMRSASKTEG